jgi:phytoene dehydrogenase-like protein
MEGCLKNSDVVIVGGGHNGLVAACYLADAGKSVTILERLDHTGGAAVSQKIFDGVDVRISKYSYLVSLLPRKIINDLDLEIELLPRIVSSYSPTLSSGVSNGLLVQRPLDEQTRDSFEAITGSQADFHAWAEFYEKLEAAASAISPTLLEPLISHQQMRELVTKASGEDIWQALAEAPIGHTLKERFADDLVRGVVATDALIGTFADLESDDLLANRCFLYHVIGNGTGEWLVPAGGMGAVTDALREAARRRGVKIHTGVEVEAVHSDGQTVEVSHDGKTSNYRWALLNQGQVDEFLQRPQSSRPGSQMKVNMVLSRLPKLKSGLPSEVAFAGTFHVGESYAQLQRAFEQACAEQTPDHPPFEIYCHTLTDRSIVGPSAPAELETMTLFGLHTPITLFQNNDATKNTLTNAYLDALDELCEGTFRECLALDAHGRPCIAAESPVDLADDLRLPNGNIFHGDLDWPWVTEADSEVYQLGQWGCETKYENVFVCGSRAKRGGAVSGIGGHNAAYALLTKAND